MRKKDLLPLLEKLDLRPSRKLGQNFLVDPNLAAFIGRQGIGETPGHVLEIGPGTGSLTRHLLDAGCRVTAVEYDVRLAEYLREEFAGNDQITIVQADATRVDFIELVGAEPWRCISNLPYSVGSPVLGRLLELPNPADRITVLIQREMADRLAAVSATKIYGSLTVRVQRQYDVNVARVVPASVFWPPPEVESAVVTLDSRADRLSPADYRRFGALVNAGFSQRRKKVARLLSKNFSQTDFVSIFESLGVRADARAEHLTVEQWDQVHAAR